jgi:hypothetical protein
MFRRTDPLPSFLTLISTLALVLAAAGWGLVYPRAEVARIAGCYRVPLDGSGGAPVLIRLDTAANPRARRFHDPGALRVERPGARPGFADIFWVRSWDKSIRIVSTDGYLGTVLTLRPAPGGLAGSAIDFPDVVDREHPSVPVSVRAVRMRCPPAVG